MEPGRPIAWLNEWMIIPDPLDPNEDEPDFDALPRDDEEDDGR